MPLFDPTEALASMRHEFGEHGGVNMSIEASTTFTVMDAETMPQIFHGQRGPDSGGCYLYGRHFNPTVYVLGRELAAGDLAVLGEVDDRDRRTPVALTAQQPVAQAAWCIDQPRHQPERQRDEAEVEHRLLHERVEEDGGRVGGLARPAAATELGDGQVLGHLPAERAVDQRVGIGHRVTPSWTGTRAWMLASEGVPVLMESP